MKLLIFVTGRGTGGDAVTAYNIQQKLEEKDVETKIVLDPSAQGYYFKKRNIEWLKSEIPAAGGHAASKKTLLKAAIKTLKASFKASRLIKKQEADGVLAIIGGGAVIGSLAAKFAKVPAVGVVATPTDTKVSLKLNPTLLLPESPYYTKEDIQSKYDYLKVYSPIKDDIIHGDKNNIIDKLPDNYNPENQSVLFSSGSTLFDGMADAVRRYAEENDDVNIFLVGDPLNDYVRETIKHPNIINLGYINYIKDLYDLIDLAITTDDGLTLHELIACQLPIVVVIGVKYGRYHNLASVFDGAVTESSADDISVNVNSALKNKEEMGEYASKYSRDVLNSTDEIIEFVLEHMK